MEAPNKSGDSSKGEEDSGIFFIGKGVRKHDSWAYSTILKNSCQSLTSACQSFVFIDHLGVRRRQFKIHPAEAEALEKLYMQK